MSDQGSHSFADTNNVPPPAPPSPPGQEMPNVGWATGRAAELIGQPRVDLLKRADIILVPAHQYHNLRRAAELAFDAFNMRGDAFSKKWGMDPTTDPRGIWINLENALGVDRKSRG